MANMTYTLRYDVPAETGARAIMAATELLRQNVTVERASAEASFPGWYEVTFDVREVDHAPDATVESEYAL